VPAGRYCSCNQKRYHICHHTTAATMNDTDTHTLELGTAEDVERAFGIPARRVRDLCRQDLFPHIRLGRQLRFDMARTESWLRSGGTRWHHAG